MPDCAIVISSVLDPQDYLEADAVLPKPVTEAQVRQAWRDTVTVWGAS